MKILSIMKTRVSFITLLLCIATFVVRASSPEVTVVDAGQKSFALYIENAESNYIQVALKDKNGVTLVNDRIRKADSFGRKYNLVNLPAGDYQLFVEDGPKIVTQPITVNETSLQIPVQRKTEIFAPAVQLNQDKLDYTLLCLNPTAVTIEIIDEVGHTNYAASTEEKGSIQRRFNLSNLSSGQYTIITKLKGDSYEKTYREVFTLGAEIAGN